MINSGRSGFWFGAAGTDEHQREEAKMKPLASVTTLPASRADPGSVHPSWLRRTDTSKDGVLGEASQLQRAEGTQTIFFGACQTVQSGRRIYELSSSDVTRLVNLL